MRQITFTSIAIVSLISFVAPVYAQQGGSGRGSRGGRGASGPRHEDTEVYEPVPKIVTPGATNAAAPSDAIVLFDGKNLDEWVTNRDKSPAKWTVADGILTVKKGAEGGGNIETKRTFKNYQLHVEWRIPENITGSDQARGNSGVFLASTGPETTVMSCRCSIRTTTRPM